MCGYSWALGERGRERGYKGRQRSGGMVERGRGMGEWEGREEAREGEGEGRGAMEG